MRFFRKRFVWAALYAILLTSFTLYVVLDTFVIERVYTVLPSEGTDENSAAAQSPQASGIDDESLGGTEENTAKQDGASQNTISAVITENSYSDDGMSIKIKEYREYDTTIYVADISVSSAEYLRTALAKNSYGRNITEKTSETAQSNQAILAINGDYYGAQRNGYVLRNGVLYRESASEDRDDLVIWADGSFEIISESDISASTLLDKDAAQILSFGPALIENGSISVSENDEVGKAMASNPRTAIAIVDDLHYLFVVSDGRTSESEGLTLYQLAEFLQGLDADIAYNLDGGGSSAMYFNGEVINNPTTNGKAIKERSVSDIVYIGY